MISRKELIFEPTKKVSTEKPEEFEELVHEVYSIELSVPVDYGIICQHQKADTELKEFRIDKKNTQNYKTTYFGRMILWTKKGEDGQHRI